MTTNLAHKAGVEFAVAEIEAAKPCPKPKHKKSERKQLEDELDRLTSLYVRKRDVFCVLCGKPVECAMHWVKRGKKQLRWDLRNVNGGCDSCNFKDNNWHEPYTAYMIRTYGNDVVLELIELSSAKKWKWSVLDLREMLADMRQRLEDLG